MADYTEKIRKNSKKIADLLNRAANFIECQEWTKGELARDINNRGVDPRSRKACRWCAEGALSRCSRSENLVAIANEAFRQINGEVLYEFNDRQTRKRNVISKMRATAREILEKKRGV